MTAASELPKEIYRIDQVRALDSAVMRATGLTGHQWMCRAAASVFARLRQHWPKAMRLLVLCGNGNNGGDGFVIAGLARQAGLPVSVFTLTDPANLKGEAAQAAHDYVSAGGSWQLFTDRQQILDHPADLIVDALLGTGVRQQVEGQWREAIEAINGHPAPVLAVDLPSGLHGDTGQILGAAVRAAVTVTFIGLKPGLLTAAGPELCGILEFADLGAPPAVYKAFPTTMRRVTPREIGVCLPPRPRHAHKGMFGHVLLLAGGPGMSGAARLAGEAALRVGAGLVTVATHPDHATSLNLARPELMVLAVDRPEALSSVLSRATVLAVGPGLGQSSWANALFDYVMTLDQPMVVDADALNLLAQQPQRRQNWVLTPHPGEAARLLNKPTVDIQNDRFAAIAELIDRYGGVALLKGAGTLIGNGAETAVCQTGNPGMASGGMGDVLTGVIAGLIAQGLDLFTAARLGALIHGLAGDLAAAEGERGLMAMDLLSHLRSLVNPR